MESRVFPPVSRPSIPGAQIFGSSAKSDCFLDPVLYQSKGVGEPAEMKAVILIPDLRTQLSNLLVTEPEFLIDFVNKPTLCRLIEMLSPADFSEFLVVGRMTPSSKDKLSQILGSYSSIKYEFLEISDPGIQGLTAILAAARSKLTDGGDSFVVISGGKICSFSMEKLLEFHEQCPSAVVTVVTTPKEQPLSGDAFRDSNRDPYISDQLSSLIKERLSARPASQETGVYVFRTRVLYERIMGNSRGSGSVAIEREVAEFECESDLCIDMCTAAGYLRATKGYIQRMAAPKADFPHIDQGCDDTVIIDSTAKIGEGCKIGPFVVIGPNSKIGYRVRLINTVVLADTEIQDNVYVENSILGPGSKVGSWTRIGGTLSVIGTQVEVEGDVYVRDCLVFPYKCIKITSVGKGVIL